MAISRKTVAGDEAVHYVPPRKKRPKPSVKMQPPLTPMIDVTFQLLLFFLLTFTFREAEGLIPGTLPQGDLAAAAAVDAPPIYIVVRPSPGDTLGAVYEVRGEHMQIREAERLYQLLLGRREVAGSTRSPVVIQPRADVRWEHVVNAFNQAVRAKYKKIGFASSS